MKKSNTWVVILLATFPNTVLWFILSLIHFMITGVPLV